MEQEELRENWAEICFLLSDNVNPNINENVFEQIVLAILGRFFEWSQYKGQIKVKPSLQIGRNNLIIPDIVLYTPDNKAAVVCEIKRPAEDLSKPENFGQLQSYMRQTKAAFGILIGREIHVYYDGGLNPYPDPLLLSQIRFESYSSEGINFVKLFNRNSFIAKEYECYLKEHIDRLELERRIDALREKLQSEETSQKMLKLLQHVFKDEETQLLIEAMKGLTINISYQQNKVVNKREADATISNSQQEIILVCKHNSTGKHFIYIEDLKGNKVLLVSPDGGIIARPAEHFDTPKDESIDYLLLRKLITKNQLEKYNEYESREAAYISKPIDDYPDRNKTKKTRLIGKSERQKNRSPSAYEWSKMIPDLSRISAPDVKWIAICNYLKVYVGGRSARVVLKEWAQKNKTSWPEIPEP